MASVGVKKTFSQAASSAAQSQFTRQLGDQVQAAMMNYIGASLSGQARPALPPVYSSPSRPIVQARPGVNIVAPVAQGVPTLSKPRPFWKRPMVWVIVGVVVMVVLLALIGGLVGGIMSSRRKTREKSDTI